MLLPLSCPLSGTPQAAQTSSAFPLLKPPARPAQGSARVESGSDHVTAAHAWPGEGRGGGLRASFGVADRVKGCAGSQGDMRAFPSAAAEQLRKLLQMQFRSPSNPYLGFQARKEHGTEEPSLKLPSVFPLHAFAFLLRGAGPSSLFRPGRPLSPSFRASPPPLFRTQPGGSALLLSTPHLPPHRLTLAVPWDSFSSVFYSPRPLTRH